MYQNDSTGERVALATRFSTTRADLHPAIALLAARVIERRNTVPILSNVVVTVEPGAVTLSGTDLDLQATFTLNAHVEAVGDSFTVDAAMLADVVKAAAKDAHLTFDYQPGTGRCTVSHGRARMALPTLPADDFPVIAQPGETVAFLYPGELAADLKRLVPFVGKEAYRPERCGIAIQRQPDALTYTATTGKCLARVTRALPCGGEDLPESSILPRKAADLLHRALKSETDLVSVAFGGGRASFEWNGARVVTKLIDADAPAFAAVLEPQAAAGLQAVAFADLEPTLCVADVETFRKAVGTAPDIYRGGVGFTLSTPDAPEFMALSSATTGESGRKFGYKFRATGPEYAYLWSLAVDRGLPVDPFTPTQVVLRRGLVAGATFGARLENETEKGQGYHRRLSPAEYRAKLKRMRDSMPAATMADLARHVGRDVYDRAESYIPPVYVDGAFSVVMPRERAADASLATFVAPDGTVYPLRTDDYGAPELSADAIRRLAGPVDKSGHIDIAPLSYFQGRPVPAGHYLPTPPKNHPGARLGASRADTDAYLKACRPIAMPGAVETSPPAAESAPPAPEPVVEAVTPPQAVAGAVEAAPAASISETTDAGPNIDALVEMVTELRGRVAAIEGTTARVQAAFAPIPAGRVRSDAERRAIIRAWRMRAELRTARAAADADRARYEESRRRRGRQFTAAQNRGDRLLRIAVASRRAVRRAEGRVWSLEERLAGADRRADRMVRAASDYRKTARRAGEDLRGARASERALIRRLDDAQRGLATATARKAPPPPTDTIMAVAFADAR